MTPPLVDLVVKSYPADYGWLSYFLRSVQKFATGFNQIIVILPRSHPLPLTAETVVLLDTPESYLHQQIAKLNADLHTHADYIVHFDSDICLTSPITPEFFFKDGKPIWVTTQWCDMQVGEKAAWYHVMAKCLLECPPCEFMRKSGMIVPRWLYKEFRDFIQKTHGKTMDAYVAEQPGREFSEYNCLGLFAWLYHRDAFHWHDTTTEGVPVWPWLHNWSWGGLKPEIRGQLERILA